MLTLSIKQPWAWLICNGHKSIENRDWNTKVRGRILIHAGKSLDRDGMAWIRHEFPHIKMPSFSAGINLGGIVGMADLTGVVTESDDPWFFGRYGFQMQKARPLPFKPVNGRLMFWHVDYDSLPLPYNSTLELDLHGISGGQNAA